MEKYGDVGLTELKKYGNKKWSLNVHDKPKNQNPTYWFSVVHRIKFALSQEIQFLTGYFTLQKN